MAIDLGEDRKLVAAAQESPTAFSFIFARYYDPIFRYCVLRTGNPRDGEDLAMDVFTEALATLPRYRWQGRPLLAWLFSIARNRAASNVRKGSMRRRAGADEAAEVSQRQQDNGLNEASIEARRLLGRIDGPTAEALVLRFVAGCSFEQIADLLGITVAAAKMRVYRAIAKARRVMGVEDEG
jgi:RNA polymerase sigma-70 factor (ECF subfamily)